MAEAQGVTMPRGSCAELKAVKTSTKGESLTHLVQVAINPLASKWQLLWQNESRSPTGSCLKNRVHMAGDPNLWSCLAELLNQSTQLRNVLRIRNKIFIQTLQLQKQFSCCLSAR